MKVILASGYDAFSLIATLIEREGIGCFWEKKGRFVGAWTPRDYKFQESRVASLNADADAGSYMVPPTSILACGDGSTAGPSHSLPSSLRAMRAFQW